MPLVQTRGAASAQGFGEFAQAATAVNYIEDVFSTYLYTGNAATRTITNGIDLSTYGGLVWFKNRTAGTENALTNTVSGTGKYLISDQTADMQTLAAILTAFNSTGFSIGSNTTNNENTASIVSWTFRKQPKFFDIQTWTGNATNRTIAHSLGVVPGCIIVKRTDTTAAWAVYHRSLANTQYLVLNTTAAVATGATWWNSTTPTSSVFSLGTDASVNASGGTYVAYLFAHDAGGFGLAGTDNVISCGTYTGNGSATGPVVTLGYEPQWVMVKASSTTSAWFIADTMRGQGVSGSTTQQLKANTADVEGLSNFIAINSTGFQLTSAVLDKNGSGEIFTYIAIRRGPMKVPTSGTSVFSPIASSSPTGTVLTTSFPVDMQIAGYRVGVDSGNWSVNDRLRGVSSTTTETQKSLITSSTAAEITGSSNETRAWSNTGFQFPSYWGGLSTIFYNFGRAPSFMDVVCYTGTGVARTITHNLAVVPELIICKYRNTTGNWFVYNASIGNTNYLRLNSTAAIDADFGTVWNSTTPTSSVFSLGTSSGVNASAGTYVAYLFATCASVSKVFSYTGNGSSQTINCGFTAGSRWVMIKRTDSTGDWYVWDSARGIIAGNDPHLSLNTTAAEVTTDDSVDTDNTGFIVNQLAATNINVTSATYIGIAIA